MRKDCPAYYSSTPNPLTSTLGIVINNHTYRLNCNWGSHSFHRIQYGSSPSLCIGEHKGTVLEKYVKRTWISICILSLLFFLYNIFLFTNELLLICWWFCQTVWHFYSSGWHPRKRNTTTLCSGFYFMFTLYIFKTKICIYAMLKLALSTQTQVLYESLNTKYMCIPDEKSSQDTRIVFS